jgi:anti-anti-sigma factor
MLNPIAMLLQVDEKQMEPGITVIELTGKLALGPDSQRIETLVDELARRGPIRVVLDMSKVDYIDSAGIGLVALASGKLKEVGGRVIVVAPQGKVLQLLSVTQIDTIVTVCPTTEKAAASFA